VLPDDRRGPAPSATRPPRPGHQLHPRARARYALHELTFALLFTLILVFPFRRLQRRAWWAAWLPVIAYLGYTLTFGAHDQAILTRSLVADIALPALLLAYIPASFCPCQGPPDR
jgi:hypothetical protein